MPGPSGETATYLLPFPLETDTADIARDTQALADVADEHLSSDWMPFTPAFDYKSNPSTTYGTGTLRYGRWKILGSLCWIRAWILWGTGVATGQAWSVPGGTKAWLSLPGLPDPAPRYALGGVTCAFPPEISSLTYYMAIAGTGMITAGGVKTLCAVVPWPGTPSVIIKQIDPVTGSLGDAALDLSAGNTLEVNFSLPIPAGR